MMESCTVTAMQNAAANHIVETVKPSQSMSLLVHTASKWAEGIHKMTCTVFTTLSVGRILSTLLPCGQ